MAVIHGGYYTQDITAETTGATSPTPFTEDKVIDCRGYAFGSLWNDNASSTTITWYAAATKNDTYRPLNDQDGVPVAQNIGASECMALPSAMAGCGYLAAVCGTTGSGTIKLTVHLER